MGNQNHLSANATKGEKSHSCACMKKKFILASGILLLIGGIVSGVWSLSLPGCNSMTCMLIGDFSSPMTTVASVGLPFLALIGFVILLYGRSIDSDLDKPKTGKGLYDDMKPEKME
jgi:hypothetical protein